MAVTEEKQRLRGSRLSVTLPSPPSGGSSVDGEEVRAVASGNAGRLPPRPASARHAGSSAAPSPAVRRPKTATGHGPGGIPRVPWAASRSSSAKRRSSTSSRAGSPSPTALAMHRASIQYSQEGDRATSRSPSPSSRPASASSPTRRRETWRDMRVSMRSGPVPPAESDTDTDDEGRAKGKKGFGAAAKLKERGNAIKRWKGAMLAVQMSHGGRLLGESSVMLLSEMGALVEDIKAGCNTVDATRKLAHMAQNINIRDAIVAAKALPALASIMAESRHDSAREAATQIIAELSHTSHICVKLISDPKLLSALLFLLQSPPTMATMEYGAKALGNMAGSEVGRLAVNAVKVGVFRVGAATNSGISPVTAAKLSVLETAKRNGLSMADCTATDVLLQALKERYAGHFITAHSAEDRTVANVIHAVGRLAENLKLRTKLANSGIFYVLSAIRSAAQLGSLTTSAATDALNVFVDLGLPVDGGSEGLPGVMELAQRLKDPASSLEMKAVMAAGLSRCAINQPNCELLRGEGMPRTLVEMLKYVDDDTLGARQLTLQILKALGHLAANARLRGEICETEGVGERVVSLFKAAAAPSEDGISSAELRNAAAQLVFSLTHDEGARKTFSQAGVVEHLMQMTVGGEGGESQLIACRALKVLLERDTSAIGSVLATTTSFSSASGAVTAHTLAEWQAFIAKDAAAARAAAEQPDSGNVAEGILTAIRMLQDSRPGNKGTAAATLLLQVQRDAASRRAVLSQGTVPLLVEMLEGEADARDAGTALQVLSALAEEPSNRYMLGSNTELLRLLGEKLTVKESEDQVNAEYAGKTLAALTSMWGVRDRVREAGLLQVLVRAIHPLAGLNQRAKEAAVRALCGLCDTDADSREVASKGVMMILQPLLTAAYHPLRSAAYECLSRILTVTNGEVAADAESVESHDAVDKVMAMLTDSSLQSQLTAARMVTGMSAELLAEIGLRGGLAILLMLMQYGHTDEQLIEEERKKGLAGGGGSSRPASVASGGDLGKALVSSILQPKAEERAVPEDSAGEAAVKKEAAKSTTLSEKTKTLRKLAAGGGAPSSQSVTGGGSGNKKSDSKKAAGGLWAGKAPGAGKQAKKWSVVAGVAVMNSAAGAVTRILTHLNPLDDKLMEVVVRTADVTRLAQLIDPKLKAETPNTDDPICEGVAQTLLCLSVSPEKCQEIFRANGIRGLVACLSWGVAIAMPALTCIHRIVHLKEEKLYMETIRAGIVHVLVGALKEGLCGRGVAIGGNMSAEVLEMLLQNDASVREEALTLGAVDSAAVPLRQLEAGHVSTVGTIGVQVATKIMAHLGCSGEKGAEAAAVAAIGPIIRIASGWTEAGNVQLLARTDMDEVCRSLTSRVATALLTAVTRQPRVAGAFVAQGCLAPTVHLIGGGIAKTSGALSVLKLQESAARAVHCVMDDADSLRIVMAYIGPPLARLLSSMECTREAMEVGARIMSRLARESIFVDTLAFSQLIPPTICLVGMREARELARVMAAETLVNLARYPHHCMVIVSHPQIIDGIRSLLDEGVDAGRIASCNLITALLDSETTSRGFALKLLQAGMLDILKPLLNKKRAALQRSASEAWQMIALKSGDETIEPLADILTMNKRRSDQISKAAVAMIANMSTNLLRRKLLDKSNTKILAGLVVMLKSDDPENVQKALQAMQPLLSEAEKGPAAIGEAHGLPALYDLIAAGSTQALDFWRELFRVGRVQMLPHLMSMLRDPDSSEEGQTYAINQLSTMIHDSADFRQAFLDLPDGMQTLVGISLHGGDFVMSYHGPPPDHDDSSSDKESLWDDSDESDEEEVASTMVPARVAALKCIMSAANGPDEVLTVSKARTLEAVQRSVLSLSQEVSSTASECWEHLFKVGGTGVVPAAIDFLCNDKGSLRDRDVGAQALAHLSETHTPRDAILDSQRAIDGLVALIANWDGPDGGAVGKANAARALTNLAYSSRSVVDIAGTGVLPMLARCVVDGPEEIADECYRAFSAIVHTGKSVCLPHLVGMLSFEHDETVRAVALEMMLEIAESPVVRGELLSNGAAVDMLVRLLRQDTSNNKVGAMQVMTSIAKHGAEGVGQLVQAGVVEILHPIIALAQGVLRSNASTLWWTMSSMGGPKMIPALVAMATEDPGSEHSRETAARGFAMLAESSHDWITNRKAILEFPGNAALKALVKVLWSWGAYNKELVFRTLNALSTENELAAQRVGEAGAFDALEAVMREAETDSVKTGATDVWMRLVLASRSSALPRVLDLLDGYQGEHESLLGAAAGALAQNMEINLDGRTLVWQRNPPPLLALISLLQESCSSLTRTLALKALTAITFDARGAAEAVRSGVMPILETLVAGTWNAAEEAPGGGETKKGKAKQTMSQKLRRAVEGSRHADKVNAEAAARPVDTASVEGAVEYIGQLCEVGGDEVMQALTRAPGAPQRLMNILSKGGDKGRTKVLSAVHYLAETGGRRARVQLTSSGVLKPLLRVMQGSGSDADAAGQTVAVLLWELPYDAQTHQQILDTVSVAELVHMIGSGDSLIYGNVAAEVAALLIAYVALSATDCNEIYETGVITPLLKVLDHSAKGDISTAAVESISAGLSCLAQICSQSVDALQKVANVGGVGMSASILEQEDPAGGPAAGRLLGQLAAIPGCKVDVFAHIGALIQLATGQAGDDLGQEAAAVALQEIVQSYEVSGSGGSEESEFRDLVRPLMVVLKTGTLKARQAAATALARLAEDRLAAELIGALGGVKDLVFLISNQYGVEAHEDGKGLHVDAGATALAVLSHHSDHRSDMLHCKAVPEMLNILGRGNPPAAAAAARCLHNLCFHHPNARAQVEGADYIRGIRRLALHGLSSQRDAALQLLQLLDRRAYEKMCRMNWKNPTAERRSLVTKNILKQVAVKMALQKSTA